MILNLKKKEEVIHKIHEIAKNSIFAMVATFTGITVNEITQLRKSARNIGTHMYVVRNTLLRRVVEKTVFLSLKDTFFGQNFIVFSNTHPRDSVRIFIDFSKKKDNFKIKGAVFEGKFIDSSNIDFLSNLPTHEESLSNLVLVMKFNSVGNLVRVLYAFSIKKQ